MASHEAATARWQDPDYAERWSQADRSEKRLGEAFRVARAAVETDLGGGQRLQIADIGSGPGRFLEEFLDAFPSSIGYWVDSSPAMEPRARETLARFGDRVHYLFGDMSELGVIGLPPGLDVVTTARATHHLSIGQLEGFYRGAATLLRPGGWLANLDHVRMSPEWDERVAAVRAALFPASARPGHEHTHPLPTDDEQRSSFAAAGFTQIEVMWRLLKTVLLIGRR